MNTIEGIKILLVDDELHILQFLELGLANEGFEVKTALDGLTGLAGINVESLPYIFDRFYRADASRARQ